MAILVLQLILQLINHNPMQRAFIVLLSTCVFLSCHSKKEIKKDPFIPVLSLIKGQIADVDTSLYSIRRIVFGDSSHNDTTYIPREEFKNAAVDFLNIPDITEPDFAGRYSESSSYDENINRAMIVYEPKDPQKEQIQREEVLINPDGESGKVSSIIINSIISSKDSLLEKKLLWQIDKSFQATIIRQKLGQPETTTTYKVIWGEDE